MSMENLGPYSNFHELNQDWFLNEFNKLVEQWKAMQKNFDNLQDAFNDLKSYVQDYFKNLDVQEEINNKLEEMYNSGKLNELLNLFIPYITPEMFGAVGDGLTDDTENFKKFIANCYNTSGICDFGKTYLINSDLIISKKVNINLNQCTIAINGAIKFESDNNIRDTVFKNGHIKVLKDSVDSVITIHNLINSTISDIFISDFINTGIMLKENCYETQLINIKLYAKSNGINSVGIINNSSDTYITNCFGRDCHIFIINNGVTNYYNSCHAWIITSAILPDSVFAKCNISANFTNCVIDTYVHGFELLYNSTSSITNNYCIINPAYYNGNILKQDCYFIFYITTSTNPYGYGCNISNNKFQAPETDIFINKAYFINVKESLLLNFFNNNYCSNVSGFYNLPKTENCILNNNISSGTVIATKNQHTITLSFNAYLTENYSDNAVKIGSLPDGFEVSYAITGLIGNANDSNNISDMAYVYCDKKDIYVTPYSTDKKRLIIGTITHV